MSAAKKDDPCVEPKELAENCLNQYSFFKNCRKYIVNLQLCREFWARVKNERREQGIQPILPAPEEREKILDEAFGS
ncbi:unnamed protein product [Hymenolepis diminuta]|uniref:Coiled-coil-helix-coiled-coil-helix domain-containing protein 7 n=1 Tax=Hymenolepis diminuta TaxID=6216 RepID=A0A564YKZ3_HYMDI|nr:unnamed protein product [Hymenolepis diminuta]